MHRVAHFFWKAGLPLIPRMMSESVHGKTGVVIGETAVIGDGVKIYQGVTLGATILGGSTDIGAHSIMGGNVWLTHSVPAWSKVYLKEAEHMRIESRDEVTGDPEI